jgi:hypothetical protein
MDTSSDPAAQALLRLAALRVRAERVLGPVAWLMLSRFGRVTSGRFTGRYVSGLPVSVAEGLVMALARGETVQVHLMHRHVSGTAARPPLSSLRFRDGRLVMVVAQHEEPA